MRVLVVDDEQPALDELAYLLAAEQRVAEVRHQLVGDRRAADPAGGRDRRGLPRHPDARTHRARAGPGAEPLPLPAAGRLRHRPRAARRRGLRPARGRLRAQAGPRRPARRGRTPGGRRRRRRRRVRAGPRRRAGRRRARRRDPLHQPLRHHARRGAGRLRPAAHRDRVPPGAQPADDARGGVGQRRLRADPPLAAGLALARHRGADGRRPLHGRRRPAGVELGVSRRHTRELRELLLASRTVGP